MKTQKSWLLLFGVLLCLYFPQVLAQRTNSQLTEEVTKNESGTKSTENPPNVEKTTAVGNHSELLGENSHSENNLAENTDGQFAFQDGKDYFSYTIPIKSSPIDGRIEVILFFNYECAYCLTAFDNLNLYQRLHDEQIRLILQPIATQDALFSPNVYYSLVNLDRQGLAELLLFDSAEKSGKNSLVVGENLYHWLINHNVALDQFLMQIKSQAVADKAKDSVELTEKYGVFTSPFVVINGQYVLTSSTLYNDDYTFAVMDFLISRILQQQQHKNTFTAETKPESVKSE